jgi:heat shock protein HslJ
MPTTVAPGTYPVTAQYSGDASDNASTSAADNVTVIAATKTTLTISPNPAGQDQIVSLTGTVKETYGTAVPTGTVTFSAGGTAVGSGMLNNGTVTINLSDFGIAAGKYTVTATYSGNTSNAASSATVNLTVQ